MKKKHFTALIFIVLLCILSFTACDTKQNSENVDRVITEEKKEEKTEFTDTEEEKGQELSETEENAAEEEREELTDREYDSVSDKVYRQILLELIEKGIFVQQEGVRTKCDGMPYDNTYSVMDVDNDGKEELLIHFGNTFSMAGMVLYIYDYDRDTEEIYIEYMGFPDITIFENGYLKEGASHNHGRSDLDDFWPYSLYLYNEETDIYENVACVDAWQKVRMDMEPDPDFPTDKDTDGDGIVYYDWGKDYYQPQTIMDNAEYEKWCENYNTAKKIEILWYPIISEEKYNEMHSDTAAG